MLFDEDTAWIRRLAREAGLGKRDVMIRSVEDGANEVTFVSAKSDEGLAFVRAMEKKLPVVSETYDEDDDRDYDYDDEEE